MLDKKSDQITIYDSSTKKGDPQYSAEVKRKGSNAKRPSPLYTAS